MAAPSHPRPGTRPKKAAWRPKKRSSVVLGRAFPIEELERRDIPAASLQGAGSIVYDDVRNFWNNYVQIGDFGSAQGIAILDASAVQAVRMPIEPQLQDALRLAMTLATDRTLAPTLSPELERWRDQLFAWHASRTAAPQPTANVILVDANLADSQTLIQAAASGTQVFAYDIRTQSAESVLSTVVSWATNAGVQIGSLAIFSHGAAGEFALGNDFVSLGTLSQTAGEWQQLASVMAVGGSIELYSCDVAASPVGQELLDELAALTGATVYGSTDLTGFGGDWTLEASSDTTGPTSIGVPAFLDAQRLLSYQFTLATQTLADNFNTVSYSNNDGTVNWTGDWVESDGSGGGASAGKISINTGALRLADKNPGDNIYRQADLSDAASATLSFTYVNALNPPDEIDIQVSSDGGANYSTLPGGVFTDTINTGSGTFSADISAYTSANTRVRFSIVTNGSDKTLRVDNLQISYVEKNPTANNDSYTVNEDSTLTVGPSSASLANLWNFNAGSGQTAVDSGSAGNNGALGDSSSVEATDPTWNSGYIGGGGLSFDGVDDYVSTTSTVARDSNNFTLAAWFQTNTTSSQHHILWEGWSGGDGNGNPTPGDLTSSEMNLSVGTYNSANKIVFFLGYDVPGAGNDPIYIVSSDDFTDTTQWHHVAVSVTDLGGGVFGASLYVDGKLEGSDTGTDVDRSQWGALQIGKPAANTRYFDGQIDEVRVYDASLSSGQIQAIAQSGVLQNDTDPQNLQIQANLVSGPSNGTLSFNPDGSFVYTPNANFYGTDSFTYVATNGTYSSTPATVTLNVTPVNDAPSVSVPGSQSVNRNSTLVFSTGNGNAITVSDIDAANGLMSITLSSTNGTLTLGSVNGLAFSTGDGTNDSSMQFTGTLANVNAALQGMSFKPTTNFSGAAGIGIVVNDQGNTGGGANSASDGFGINVVNTNVAPVAANDSYSLNEDATLTVPASGVLGNDTDGDSDPLTATVVSGPTHGSLTFNADGSFVYTPNANYHGGDSFTYRANDGTTNSNLATVTLTINSVNDVPVAGNESYSLNEDGTLIVPASGVLGNDTDIDADTLTAVLVTGPTHGSLTLNPDGTFTYTPNANYNGSDSFTYRANDGTTTSNLATVAITVTSVNDAPVATDDSFSTNEDTPLNVPASGVLGNDADVDGDTLTAALVSGPSHGSLTLNPDGSFSYTPNANYNGGDSFTYRANDGTADSNLATVTITVNSVNDVPVANDDSYGLAEDGALNVGGAGVLGNDTDVEGDPLTASVVSGPAHGTLSFNADGSFLYTPAANYNGTDSFTYVANDSAADSNIATVTITVTSVNDAPVALDDAYSTNEDTLLTVPANGVLGNDSDIDGDALSAILVSGPSHGSLTLNPDGSFTYTPNANYNGSDSFTYRANDGTADSNLATVAITVNSVNDAPVAANDSYGMAEDGTLNVGGPGVLGIDTDVEGDPLTANLVSGPAHGGLVFNSDGSFVYTPNANYNGTDSFTYLANDGSADSNLATVTITISAVNDAPVAVDESYSTNEDNALNVPASGVLGNDSDVDGDPLTAALVSGPTHGSLTLYADGSFAYTPDANYNGIDSFTYAANDGAANSNVATVHLTIVPVNDAPVAVDDSYSVNEDNVLTAPSPGALGNDTDVEGDSLTASLVTGPLHGSLAFNADGSFVYTPDANYNGTDSFVYVVTDGTDLSNTAVVHLTISAVNDPPVAVGESYHINEDNVLIVPATGVLANDSDVDGDPLTTSLITAPAYGTLTLNADGSFTYTPNTNFNGVDSFEYVATDGSASSATTTVTIFVDPVNDAPVAGNDAFSTNAGMPLYFTSAQLKASASDVDGDPLTVILEQGPAHGTLAFFADGSFKYTPNAGYAGFDSFLYRVSDGSAESNAASVVIQVKADGLTAVPPSSAPPSELPFNADPFAPFAEAARFGQEQKASPGSNGGAAFAGGVGGGGEAAMATSTAKGSEVTSEIVNEASNDELIPLLSAARVSTSDPVEPARRLGSSASSEPTAPHMATVPTLMTGSPVAGVFLVPDPLRRELNRFSEEVHGWQSARHAEVWVVSGVAWSATAGYLVWNLRTIAVFATVALTTRPLWKQFDPIVVLDRLDRRKDDEEEVGRLFD